MAVAQGADGDDVAGGAAEHTARLLTYGIDMPGDLFHRDNGGLAKHDSFFLLIDKHVGRPEVNADINAKHQKVLSAHSKQVYIITL